MSEENKEIGNEKQAGPDANQLLSLTNDLINAFHQAQLLLEKEREARASSEKVLAVTQYKLSIAEEEKLTAEKNMMVMNDELKTMKEKIFMLEMQLNGQRDAEVNKNYNSLQSILWPLVFVLPVVTATVFVVKQKII